MKRTRRKSEIWPACLVDWPALLTAMKMTDGEIVGELRLAYGLDYARTTIQKLRAGTIREPRYSLGVALLTMAGK